MKIAIVAPTSMPARRANTFQVAKMAQSFCSLGHTVQLAIPRGDGPRTLTPDDDRTWEEFAYHYGLRQRFRVEWLPARTSLRRYDYGFAALIWARRWGADLIYSRLPQCAAVGSLSGFPTVFEMHDIPQGVAAPLLLRIFLSGSGKRRLVVISRALANELQSRFQSLGIASFAYIAPDGVDLERYANLPGPSEARQAMMSKIPGLIDRFTAGYTGNLYPGRGIELVLKLAARLTAINFLIVGGEPPAVLKWQQAVKSGNLPNVFVVGFVPNQELPMYQACCEALLMPYQAQVEASSGGNIAPYLSPMKAFEYLACGRAILSSDLPVLREVLNDQIAILLPPADTDAWAAALQRVSEHQEYRANLASEALKVAGQYTWDNRARGILEGIARL